MSQIAKNSLLEVRAGNTLNSRRTTLLKSSLGQSAKVLSKSFVLSQRSELKKELLVLEEQVLKNRNFTKKSKNLEKVISKAENEFKNITESH